jgi:hypothetical protein
MDEPKAYGRRRGCGLAAALLAAFLVLYVGAYAVLCHRQYTISMRKGAKPYPTYFLDLPGERFDMGPKRVSEELTTTSQFMVRRAFLPAHHVDKLLRPKYWAYVRWPGP